MKEKLKEKDEKCYLERKYYTIKVLLYDKVAREEKSETIIVKKRPTDYLIKNKVKELFPKDGALIFIDVLSVERTNCIYEMDTEYFITNATIRENLNNEEE